MNKQLLKLSYHRNDNFIREAFIKESQLVDIKNLPNIKIVAIDIAPSDAVRSYVLM